MSVSSERMRTSVHENGELSPAYPENVRLPGVDRKSPESGQTDAIDPTETSL